MTPVRRCSAITELLYNFSRQELCFSLISLWKKKKNKRKELKVFVIRRSGHLRQSGGF